MKSKLLIVLLILTFLLTFCWVSYSEARSGCCSHHGGVCGCKCCDGIPLSAKCAPYYSNCTDEK